MVEYVLAALRAAPEIGRIALVGPARLPPEVSAAVDVSIAAPGPLLDNLAAGLAAFAGPAPVLVAAADLPFLSAAAVSAFLAAAGAAAPGADAAYAIVPGDEIARAAPGIRKTVVRFADGPYTGGSLVLIRPDAFLRARLAIERAMAARKRPWALARLFGLRTVLGLAAGRLRIADLERRAEAITGIRARAVICRDAGVALDVDRPEALAAARRLLAHAGAVGVEAR